jgi:hypothetical protein
MAKLDAKDNNKIFAFVRHIYHELKPIIPIVIVVAAITYPGSFSGRIIDTTLNVLFWLRYKDFDDDDDRWKKRKRKLKDKVQIYGSKLTVVPETA